MTSNRILLLEGDVYQLVFEMLDAEPDISGDVAGLIATRTASAFRELLTIQLDLAK